MTVHQAIEVDRVSKRYRLGEYHSAGTLAEAASAVLGSLRRRRGRPEEIWSLRDVSLSLQEGHALGVIGRNGAGKSTLLKVLARITEPTSGVSRTRGRVAALLEVGTGFHGELTGRENLFLNGAILGMSRRDMTRRFDDIVSFAGVERFIDTPVKRYSSGMYLRLAFSVAAHIEPDILVVDEVLAVGDAEFQAKCVGRMHSAEREGRTVVFVSHNLDAVAQLCNEAIWLERGVVTAEGSTESVIDAYVAEATSLGDGASPLMHTGDVILNGVRLVDESGDITLAPAIAPSTSTYTIKERCRDSTCQRWSSTRPACGSWTRHGRIPKPVGRIDLARAPCASSCLRCSTWAITGSSGRARRTRWCCSIPRGNFPARGSNRERPERAVALFLPWEIIDEQAPGLTVDADSADSNHRADTGAMTRHPDVVT